VDNVISNSVGERLLGQNNEKLLDIRKNIGRRFVLALVIDALKPVVRVPEREVKAP